MSRRIFNWSALALPMVVAGWLAGYVGCASWPPAAEPIGGPASRAAVATAPVAPFAMGVPDVVLLVTGGGEGLLEVCNCPGPMAGGLSRRSGLFASYRAAFPNVIAIDTGDFMPMPKDNSVRGEYLLRAYQRLGYDVLTMGDREFADIATLREFGAPAHAAMLSTTASLRRGPPQAPLYPPNLATGGGQRLWFVSYLREDALTFVPDAHRPVIADANTAVAGEIAQAAGRAVVVVAHGDEDAVASVAKMEGVSLILRGHTGQTEMTLGQVCRKPVVKAGGNDYVGVVAMKLRGGTIAAIEYRAELVDERWPLDREVMAIYQTYAHHEMRLILDGPKAAGLNYVPAATCGACHRIQYNAWLQTRHAGAYRSLERVKRTDDPNCVACHTAGFGTQHGFTTAAQTPGLGGVTCQDCHRTNAATPGHPHRPPEITSDVCAGCHTPVQDPKFNYARKRPMIACPE